MTGVKYIKACHKLFKWVKHHLMITNSISTSCSINIQVSQVSPTRPERAEAPSPGQRPGCLWMQTCRPVRAKAFKYLAINKAFALTGRLADCHYTQGDALG